MRLKTDWILFVTVILLVFFGALMIYSASSVKAEQNPKMGTSYYFIERQVFWLALGLVVMMLLRPQGLLGGRELWPRRKRYAARNVAPTQPEAVPS